MSKTGMTETDLWLERWLPLIGRCARAARVLELGCDVGRDTAYLARHGFLPVATDISAEALQACARAVPTATLVRHDLRQPFPFPGQSFGVIIGSLCLHYFEWEKTREIVAEIHRCLAPGGLLLCRLNSTRDVHHGATGFEAVAPNLYLVDDGYSRLKRFFDRDAVDSLFGPEWARVAVEEMRIDRYDKPKVVWEVVLRKGDGHPSSLPKP
jgi:SAM-dependent methyltransferase